MTTKDKKSLLVVVRHSPYGSSLARTSLEVALSSATFDQDVGLLFIGDGVFHLQPEQDSSGIGMRNIARLIASFPLYDLDSLFADRSALIEYGLDQQELPQNLQQMNDDAMADLLNRFDHIVSF